MVKECEWKLGGIVRKDVGSCLLQPSIK